MSFTKLYLEPTPPDVIRRWLGPLLLSLVILAAGIAWTLRIGAESNVLYHRLSHLEEGRSDLRTYLNLREAARR